MVGELLLALEIEDMGKEETTIVIEGDVLNPPRTVVLNHPEVDPDTGLLYLSNDVLRTRIKVALEDVPTSSSFRAQQLNSLSEAVKSLPPDMQQVVMPFMIDLMDLPRKKEVVEAIRMAQAGSQADPEKIRAEVKAELLHELKVRELDIKERVGNAQVEKLVREAVQVGVQSAFSAMQAGAQVAMNPAIAPIADEVMKGAGYQRPNPGGDDPNYPTPVGVPMQPAQTDQGVELGDVRKNTSPAFPPVPQQPEQGMTGIETPETTDNLQGAEQ